MNSDEENEEEGRSPAAHYSREQALSFPFNVDSHDTGLRYLFDFSIAAQALQLRPGAHVLDFASGSAYVSELLNRLGYRTTACDLDPETLRHGRERIGIDSRCDPQAARFVASDGAGLPFCDGSFDGVLCMNALHHMDSYRDVLRELHRVLRPGGRAAFSEPGSEHSRSPDSVNAMRQFGVVEKDIVLPELYELAIEIGFERMLVKPFIYPEYVALDYPELVRFRQGEAMPGHLVSPAQIGEVLEKSHSIFCLVKEGEAERNSANAPPQLLDARLHPVSWPDRARRGQAMRIDVECENTGESTWLAQPREAGGHVTLGVKVLAPNGRLLDDGVGRTALDRDVRPGERVALSTEVDLSGFEPGRYRVVIDMVNERVAWFQDLGREAQERWLELGD